MKNLPNNLCKIEDIISHEQNILQNPQRNTILKIKCRQSQLPNPTLSTTITTIDHLLRSNSMRIHFPKHIHRTRRRRILLIRRPKKCPPIPSQNPRKILHWIHRFPRNPRNQSNNIGRTIVIILTIIQIIRAKSRIIINFKKNKLE